MTLILYNDSTEKAKYSLRLTFQPNCPIRLIKTDKFCTYKGKDVDLVSMRYTQEEDYEPTFLLVTEKRGKLFCGCFSIAKEDLLANTGLCRFKECRQYGCITNWYSKDKYRKTLEFIVSRTPLQLKKVNKPPSNFLTCSILSN